MAVAFVFSLLVGPVHGANAASACAPGLALAPHDVQRLTGTGCDLTGRLVRVGAAGVHIPDAGTEVRSSVLTTHGEQSVTVSVTLSGVITVTSSDIRPETTTAKPVGPGTEPEECFSSARLQSTHERKPPDRSLVWSYNGAGEPRPGMYMAIWLGAEHMTYGVNDCGLAPGQFGINHLGSPGSTSRGDFTSDGHCAYSYDNLNVVDWGDVGGFLAVACSRTIVDVPCILASTCMTTSDVRFSPEVPWFFADEVPEPAAQPLCGSSASSTTYAGYDLMSVSAHEFGHVWGLDHVTEEADPRMTMSPLHGICDFSGRFIGLGDYVGMCERWCPVIVNGMPPSRRAAR